MLRAVMDTDVLYSALRSGRGASAGVLAAWRAGLWRLVISNHLLHEYEEILRRRAGFLRLASADIEDLLDDLCDNAEEWTLRKKWTPLLHDRDDEPLIHLAVESEARLIVSYNVRHLQPARRLGVQLLNPSEFLTMLGPV